MRVQATFANQRHALGKQIVESGGRGLVGWVKDDKSKILVEERIRRVEGSCREGRIGNRKQRNRVGNEGQVGKLFTPATGCKLVRIPLDPNRLAGEDSDVFTEELSCEIPTEPIS